MKNFIFFLFLGLLSMQAFPQKMVVKVIRKSNSAVSGWRILDENYRIAFPGSEYDKGDSVTFSLSTDQRYFLEVSVNEVLNADTDLYSVILNNEPVMLIKADIGPGDHFFPFFTGVRQENVKITGGTTASITDFPYQVYFIAGNYRCGGTIIGDKWILTAAHCTEDDFYLPVPVADMKIRVGLNNPQNPADGQTYDVKNVIVHEGYDNQTLLNDIALLELTDTIHDAIARPVKLVTSTDVSEGATDPGVMSWVTGWGLTSVSPEILPTTLQKVQLPVITNSQAAVVWSSIPATDIMAGFLNGNKDACSGDSGGPMVVPVFGDYKIAGIVSWGSKYCNTYGAYTRVSDFESWIRSKTGIEKEYWPPRPSGDSIVCQGTLTGNYSIGDIPGATSYEWNLLPSDAGSVSGASGNSLVTWNTSYTGSANLIARVTIDNVISEWSALDIRVAKNTVLTGQSSDTAMCAQEPITLTAAAEGTELVYNWYKDGELSQTGSTADYSLSSAIPSNSGIYQCEVKGVCGTVTTDPVDLAVYPITNIYSLSADTSVTLGSDVTLKAKAEGHDLAYKWQKNKIPIGNSDTSILALRSLDANDIGLYRVIVNGTCRSDTGKMIYVYVRKAYYSTEPDVFVWPTLTSGELHIALSDDEIYNILVFDSTGRLIIRKDGCQYETTLYTGSLPPGLCIVSIYNDNLRKSVKIIKEHP